MHELIFRCDGANIKNIGTGHVYRSLAIANKLVSKYKIQKNKIKFVCKKYKNYKKIKNLIENNKYNVVFFDKKKEFDFLKKHPAKCLIIDRIKKENQKNINNLNLYFKKIIVLDSLNKNLKKCLRINALNHNNQIKYSGYKYLITPIINSNFLKNKNKKKIMIHFGKIKKKDLIFKIIKKLISIKILKKYKFIISNNYNINKPNIEYFNNKNFYKKLSESEISIISGGLILFDACLLNNKIICFPQDIYQLINLKKLTSFYGKNCRKLNNINHVKELIVSLVISNKKSRSKNRIIDIKNMNNAVKIIYKYIYDQ